MVNLKNKEGFSLTEVMIGMAILTVAIVASTNLLITLMRSNDNNVRSLQAYYLAQEGIEAVRNIRDTNWLHNQNWLGRSTGEPWGVAFKPGETYTVGFVYPTASFVDDVDLALMSSYSPWKVSPGANGAEIKRVESVSGYYLTSENLSGEDTGFEREIKLEPYECGAADFAECEDYLRVVSTVRWKQGQSDREVSLEEILTDWKGGVL